MLALPAVVGGQIETPNFSGVNLFLSVFAVWIDLRTVL
jgi:hypothetical protein